MKALAITLLLITAGIAAQACDVCGCGVGSYYFGVMPQYHKNFAGIRYRSASYLTHLDHTHNGQAAATKEMFQTAELWARFYPLKRKIQAMLFVPYQYNWQQDGGTTRYLQGFGDAVLLVNYNLLNTTQDSARLFKHNLFIGGGIKLPTGKADYNSQDASQVANPNFQLGSGSTDFIVNFMYTLRYKRYGLNLESSVKLNGKNKWEYHFGNKISGTATAFCIVNMRKLGVMPYAGIYAESSRKNTSFGDVIAETGGTLTAATIGTDVYMGRFAVGASAQKPIAQHLSNGLIKAQDRFNLHVTFLF